MSCWCHKVLRPNTRSLSKKLHARTCAACCVGAHSEIWKPFEGKTSLRAFYLHVSLNASRLLTNYCSYPSFFFFVIGFSTCDVILRNMIIDFYFFFSIFLSRYCQKYFTMLFKMSLCVFVIELLYIYIYIKKRCSNKNVTFYHSVSRVFRHT